MDNEKLDLKDVKSALAKHKHSKEKSLSRHEMIMRLFAYIGWAFIFAGLGIYINMVWDDLPSLPRVIITLGTGFTAYILGIIFARNERFEKAATPAHIIAFLLQPIGLFVLLHEYSSGDNVPLAALIVFGLLTVQQFFTFIHYRKTSFIFFNMMYFLGFLGGFIEYFEFHRAFSTLVVGLSFLLLTIDLQNRAGYKDLTPFFYILSTSMFFSGLYYYTGNTLYDPVNLSISMILLMLSVLKNSKTLYVLSILYVISFLVHGPGGYWIFWSWRSEWAAVSAGISVILCGMWLKRTDFTSAIPLWYFFGTAYWLGGAFAVLHETSFEVLYIALSSIGIYSSLLLRSRASLAVSIIFLISYISYFTHEHFEDTVGWPLMLVLLGFMMLGAGVFYVRFSKAIEQKIQKKI